MRIIYLHVPAAWLGMAGWSAIAVASLMQLVWRHPLAAVAARAIAVPGAVFAAICLATGSLWGRPDLGHLLGVGRADDVDAGAALPLFRLYRARRCGRAGGRRRGALTAIFGLVGAVNLPIIHYSVIWWRTPPPGPSIALRGTSTIDAPMLWPLLPRRSASPCCSAAIVLMRMRAELARNKVEARLRRKALEA